MLHSKILSLLIPVSRRFVKLPNRSSAVINSSSTNWRVLQNYQPKREYKKFGHKEKPEPLITKIFCIFCGTIFLFSLIDWRWCRMLYLRATGQLKEKEDREKVVDEVT
ncbi:unnamed protein product [Ceutorhynchus assimilis]|uniref:Uncharacterized protein n=1 Tax=Ceutorhynchus assimilis TaxID=467358 RepID=A0A9N9MTH4_9CUCU|nr:unnamed protein product [Ceutorhynchus assimilis]